MWRLISTWDRDDGSVTQMYAWSTPRRPFRRRSRSPRVRRTRRPAGRSDGTDLGARAATALVPVVRSHGIDVPPQPQRNSVVWCSNARVIDQDGNPNWCTDLWVHLDPSAQTIAVGLEQHGLAEQLTGRTHWDGPITVDLAIDLDDALAVLAEHLDRLCGAVIVAE